MAVQQYYINNLFFDAKSMYLDERDGTLKLSDDKTWKNRWLVEMETESETKSPTIYCNIRSVQNNGYLKGETYEDNEQQEKEKGSNLQKSGGLNVTVTQDKGAPKGSKTWIIQHKPDTGIKTLITNATNGRALTFDGTVVTASGTGQPWLFEMVAVKYI